MHEYATYMPHGVSKKKKIHFRETNEKSKKKNLRIEQIKFFFPPTPTPSVGLV